MTQIAVAQAFGKPQSFVSKCESGERRIDVVELGAFAHLYHKPLGYFVAETEAPTGASLSADGDFDGADAEQARPTAGRKNGTRVGSGGAARRKR